MEISLKSKNRVTYDPAIPLLGIYPEKIKTLSWKGACISVFIAALFTTAKTWKQPKCPLTWMDKEDVVYVSVWMCVCVFHCVYLCIHNEIVLSHKKEWNNTICSNMDGPRDFHTKWSKSEKDKYHMILLICGI